jgi:peptidoglycan/LPS O-acetylase OafA/YrhL
MNITRVLGHRGTVPDGPRLHSNNFDLLRLLFATAVCLAHCYVLSGYTELRFIALIFSSTVAVKSFFVVSGFLIFMSYERSSSLSSYFEKRVRRIYPAYLTVVTMFATVLVFASSKPASAYFSAAWLKYVAANLVFLNFLQGTLPGVFEHNIVQAVNGALWTLKIEVMFYLTVPLIVTLIRRFSVRPVLVIIYILSVLYVQILQSLEGPHQAIYAELSRQLPGQLCYFVAGAFFYYHLTLLERHSIVLVMASVAALACNFWTPLPWLEPFALATIVSFFGLFNYFGNFSRYGDFSYGLYIVHFPVIQLLVRSGRFVEEPWLLVAAALICSLILAATLWHLVERRWLARGSHYVSRHTTMPATKSFQ